MKRLLIALIALVPLAAGAERLDYTGDGANGFVTGESVTAANMNEINTAVDDNADDIDALEAVDAAFPGDNIIDGSIDASELDVNSVGAAEIQAGAVAGSELAGNAVTSDKIANGTILAADISVLAITEPLVALNAITNAKMADDAIGPDEMADGDHGDISWSGGVATVDAVSAPATRATSTGGALTINTTTLATAAADYDLPDSCDSATGNFVTLIVRDINEVASLTVTDTSDSIVYKGLSLGANDELDSPGAAQDSVTVICLEANKWYVTGNSGSWTDGGVAD